MKGSPRLTRRYIRIRFATCQACCRENCSIPRFAARKRYGTLNVGHPSARNVDALLKTALLEAATFQPLARPKIQPVRRTSITPVLLVLVMAASGSACVVGWGSQP